VEKAVSQLGKKVADVVVWFWKYFLFHETIGFFVKIRVSGG